mmetsp:Transcript_5511/g.12535  ORF Transcript_5511/g.12535 Transcript_5511/m.12535 type:complete len:215 (+) Transcript_5511:39-683(+)
MLRDRHVLHEVSFPEHVPRGVHIHDGFRRTRKRDENGLVDLKPPLCPVGLLVRLVLHAVHQKVNVFLKAVVVHPVGRHGDGILGVVDLVGPGLRHEEHFPRLQHRLITKGTVERGMLCEVRLHGVGLERQRVVLPCGLRRIQAPELGWGKEPPMLLAAELHDPEARHVVVGVQRNMASLLGDEERREMRPSLHPPYILRNAELRVVQRKVLRGP